MFQKILVSRQEIEMLLKILFNFKHIVEINSSMISNTFLTREKV